MSSGAPASIVALQTEGAAQLYGCSILALRFPKACWGLVLDTQQWLPPEADDLTYFKVFVQPQGWSSISPLGMVIIEIVT